MRIYVEIYECTFERIKYNYHQTVTYVKLKKV